MNSGRLYDLETWYKMPVLFNLTPTYSDKKGSTVVTKFQLTPKFYVVN